MRWWEWLLLAAALLAFLAQTSLASPCKSASFDEQYHLAAGYSYLRTGDFRLATTHPPLMGVIGGLGLLGRDDVAFPLDHPAWAAGDRFLFSDVFLWEANDNGPQLLVAARRPIMLVGALLLVFIFFFARQLLGPPAAWIALILAAFDPNLLANARLVTTDLGLTAFTLGAVWLLWRWLEGQRVLDLILAGGLAGLAMAAKYTGVMFWPIAFLIILVHPVRSQRTYWSAVGRRALSLAGMGLIAYAVLWAIYRFDFGVAAGTPFPFPLPAPFYWQNFWSTFNRIVGLEDIRLNYFMGETSAGGWWNYFLVALGVKTPLPTLILAAGGAITMLWRRRGREQVVLWAPLLAFLLLGATGVLSIGYRHILPALPFLILLAGNSADWLGASTPRRTLALAAQGLLIAWLVVGTLRFFPDHDSYFNELAGPWQNWSNLLVDSNLDWGQDLPALRDVMDDLGIEQVNLAYFGKAVPEKYGVSYHPLASYLRFVEGPELSAFNPYTPEPGWYAISATSLRLGMMTSETVDLYAYFRDLEPVARAGYSIYLYRVAYPDDMPVDRIPVIGSNVSLLTPEELGLTPGHRGQIKWMQSPEALIYGLGQGFDAAAGAYTPVDANFDDVFTLFGYDVEPRPAAPGDTVTVTLYWRVGERPMPMPAPTRGQPLSAFIHMTGDDATQIQAQYDGWRTALRGLEPGDIIVHRATIDIPAGQPPGRYPLRVGLYSPQSGERLSVVEDGVVSDHVQVEAVEVE
jgi:hypothetical protein